MTSSREKVATLVLMDFEATGLLRPGERPRITEMSMVSSQREEILDVHQKDRCPRVQNKLTLCFNPNKMIDPVASEITGLYNDMLESQSAFDEDSVRMMNLFLSRLPQPVCLLAHNGNGYDFKLLNAEIKKISGSLPESLLCADSLQAFREQDFESISPYKEQIPSSDKTPVGQPIPAIPEQALDIKGRVRQIKRKSTDYAEVPIAKSVRKRLFDSAGKSGNDEEEGNSASKFGLSGIKPLGSSMKADVVSKRTTCDVESVKKKLSFDADCDDDSDDDTLCSSTRSFDIEMSDQNESDTSQKKEDDLTQQKEDSQETLTESQKSVPYFSDQRDELQKQKYLLDSQGSLPDADFLSAVAKLENSLGESYNAGMKNSSKCIHQSPLEGNDSGVESLCGDAFSSPKSAPRPTECHTPQSGPSQASVEVTTPESALRNNHLATASENCLTPMSGLARSTAMCQLSTPVAAPRKKPEVDISSGACRALFREGENLNGKGNNVFFTMGSNDDGSILTDNSKGSVPTFSMFPGVKNKLLNPVVTNFTNGNLPSSSNNMPDLIKPIPTTAGQCMNSGLQTVSPLVPAKVSHKLGDIYRRTFGTPPEDTHNAEADCITLLRLVKFYSPQFLQWIDEHAVPLISIAPGY